MSSGMMDKVVKLNSQSAGRDRIFRLMQYGSRFIWAYLEKYKFDKETVNMLKNLEYSLSTARKLFRLGRSADIFYGALNTINLEDPTLRYTITLSRINLALYFMADHMLWLERTGLATIDKPKWSRISNKLWFYYLALNLTRDLYEILIIVNRSFNSHRICSRPLYPKTDGVLSRLQYLFQTVMYHKDITIDTIKNGCDVFIPLAQLGYVNLSPGVVGLLGVISSLVGIMPLLDHACKLTPM